MGVVESVTAGATVVAAATVDWAPVFNALVVVLAALILAVKGPVADFLRAKAEELSAEAASSQRWLIKQIVKEGVAVAERLGNSGGEKKDLAIKYVTRELNERGISVSEVVIGQLVEAGVSALKEVGDAGS